MSIVKIQGNASGTGEFTLASPNGNTNRTITLPDATGTLDRTNRAGNVLQVVHTAKTSTFVGTSVLDNGGLFIDVTGLSASITPLLATSKILIMTTLYMGITTSSGGYQQSYRLKRTIGGTVAFPILGDAEGGRPRATGRINNYSVNQYWMALNGGTHYDSPATTSAITYQVQLGGYASSPVMYLNRSETFQVLANEYDTVPVSTITLMEIAA